MSNRKLKDVRKQNASPGPWKSLERISHSTAGQMNVQQRKETSYVKFGLGEVIFFQDYVWKCIVM